MSPIHNFSMKNYFELQSCNKFRRKTTIKQLWL